MDHEHAKSIAIAINSIRVNVVSLNLLNTKTPYNVYIPKEVEFQLLQFEDAPPSYMQPNMYFALNLYYKLWDGYDSCLPLLRSILEYARVAASTQRQYFPNKEPFLEYRGNSGLIQTVVESIRLHPGPSTRQSDELQEKLAKVVEYANDILGRLVLVRTRIYAYQAVVISHARDTFKYIKIQWIRLRD